MSSFAHFSAATGLAGLILVSAAPIIFAEGAQPDSPAQHWKLTDRWKLLVEYYSPTTQKDSVSATFPVEVMPVAGAQGDLTPMRWVVLRFTASDKAPEHLRTPFTAWPQRHTGWLGKATRTDPATAQPVGKTLLQIGEASVLPEPDLDMPLEMLFPNLPAQKGADPRTGAMFELRREEKSDQILMEATFRTPSKDEIRLRQTWGKGETWWRESTRHVNGRKIFHAKVASYHSTEKLEQWLREDINLFLQDDDRLNVKVTILQDNPTAQQMLDAVQKATGVPLSVDSVLRDYEAPLGSVHLQNCSAWAVLKFIASQGFHNAQWERAGDGYHLNPYGELPPKPPKKPPKVKPNPHRTRLRLAAFFGGLFLLLLLLRIISRRRQAKNG